MSGQAKPHRYFVRSPDGRAIFGFDRLEAATVAALEMPAGSHLVDTMAQAYYPVLQETTANADGRKELIYLPLGGWDTGRFGLDRDLIEGIKKGHAAITHAFLAKGASANARDAKGGPALHWAAARGNLEIAALLLKHGADASALDATGQTALDVARAKGHVKMAALLEAAGAR